MKKILKGILKAAASNIRNTPMLIKWSWYDWMILTVLLFTGPFSIFIALVWLSVKLSIGEDFIDLKNKEKAFYYYQQQLNNLNYQVGVLKRMKSAPDSVSATSQPDDSSSKNNMGEESK